MQAVVRALTLTILTTMLLPGLAHANSASPDQLVSETAGNIISRIDNNYDTYTAEPALLEQVIRSDLIPLLDMNYTARLILGRAGRQASDQQIAAFTEAMSNLLIERYSSGLMNFRSRDQLEVMPLRGELNERATRVRTRVGLNDGGFAPVDYVFRKTPEGWKAFDVIIEGISYVSTYRNQIAPQIEADGLDSVIGRLNSGELQLKD